MVSSDATTTTGHDASNTTTTAPYTTTPTGVYEITKSVPPKKRGTLFVEKLNKKSYF